MKILYIGVRLPAKTRPYGTIPDWWHDQILKNEDKPAVELSV